ncbi:MAG: acetyl ornithine aminotransferase family protein [Thermoprotei archaeon]|nr:MAG: acetyl ornithine aminotransferase family protein [Thermoprotei archaeon]
MKDDTTLLQKAEEVLMLSGRVIAPLVIERGSGCWIYDADGTKYLDFCSSIAVSLVGHCNPKVVDAIQRQAERLIHYTLAGFVHRPAIELAEKLRKIAHKDNGKIFFTNSGTEAIEGAIKIVRGFFGGSRPWIIGFIGGFHGRSMGSLSVTASKSVQRKGFSPLLPCVEHVPYPYCYRCPFKLDLGSCDLHCASFIEEQIFGKLLDPSEVGCVVFEPIQGEGGCIIPPAGFWNKIERMCRSYGILMVADEVQTGLGRTGKWFAVEHWGINPDIICISKGLASGLPLGAIIGDRDVMSLPRGSHASTLGGNPVCCASALATLSVIEEENLVENAGKVGDYILRRLGELKDHYSIIGDIRGKGLLIGIELVDREGNPSEKALITAIKECLKRGLLIIGSGISTIRLTPPLNITIEEAEIGLSKLEEVFKTIEKMV